MKFYLSLVAVLAICQLTVARRFNITCFYDTFSSERGGFANFTETDLKTSLEYCSHVVYGYVGLRPETYELQTLHVKQPAQFAQVKKLKNQYRHIKFLVSLGGDKDLNRSEKYLKLLEVPDHKQQKFIKSVKTFLHKYNFDGLDLAYQFPHNKSNESFGKTVVKKIKDRVTKPSNKHGGSRQNENNYKNQFTMLVNKLKGTLKRDRLMLTLTVLPHVNVSKYINVRSVMGDLDFVNLGTFDYSTPKRNSHTADYLSPLYAPSRRDKHSANSNIESEVQQWLSQHVPRNKLNIGIPTYGRAWRTTKALKSSAMPVHSSLSGPALGGELTRTPGLLSWPELCFKLPKLNKSRDKKYGNYGFSSPGVRGQEGLFVTYEDRESLGAKAEYVMKNSLGGVALFDLTLDDFRGKCKDGTYPALKAIKFKLN